jgi:hypothetical protein
MLGQTSAAAAGRFTALTVGIYLSDRMPKSRLSKQSLIPLHIFTAGIAATQ